MKHVLAAISILSWAVAPEAPGAQVTLPFERLGEPFYAPRVEFAWAVTNRLPSTASIFKVIPGNVPASAVSWVEKRNGRVDPKRGILIFHKPDAAQAAATNVPDAARAYLLATNLLSGLGIPFTELEPGNAGPRAWFSAGNRGRTDRSTGQRITERHSMGVSFDRAINGLRCGGQEVRMTFQSREALTGLEVRWHPLEKVTDCQVASAGQVMSWMKEGRGRAHAVETTGSRWIKVAEIRKVTLRGLEICYDASLGGAEFDESPTHLYPFANLTAEVEFAPGDTETVHLSCPIVNEAISVPNHDKGEFNIYPSSLLERQAGKDGA